MGRKDASTSRTPVDQYRKQIGKQDYKKTRPMLRATRLKAEAKKTALGVKSKRRNGHFGEEFTWLLLEDTMNLTPKMDRFCPWTVKCVLLS
uniref:Triple QxxK/R motif-containing protein n=1 Tax=Cyanistes caeruleus TaxID=156563 RepID=A0A8C0UMG3_CYACU